MMMKNFAGILMGLALVSSAFAVTPDQAGVYTGTYKLTASDFNTKNGYSETDTVIMTLSQDGTTEITTSNGGVLSGNMTLGTVRGVLNSGMAPIVVNIKGETLKMSATEIETTGEDNGLIATFSFKLKRSKNQK